MISQDLEEQPHPQPLKNREGRKMEKQMSAVFRTADICFCKGLFYFKCLEKKFVTLIQASREASGLYTLGSLSRKKA